MYPIPPGEHLVESKCCKHCGATFPITDKDMEFYEKVSPVFRKLSPLPPSKEGDSRIPLSEGDTGGLREEGDTVRYIIPPPTLCPDCRQQRRLAFHNERKLYKTICKGTGKNIISVYPSNSIYNVYSSEYYWSDAWNPMSYGRGFDFFRSAFEQFGELFHDMPKQALVVREFENSDYLNFAYRVKNCYLIFASSENEDCYFGHRVNESKNCVDCLLVKKSEHCYECIGAFACYNCQYSERIQNCENSSFLKDCINCSDCFMCINLENKKFYIKNREYSEGEYREKRREYAKIAYDSIIAEYKAFIAHEPRKHAHLIQTENTQGDNIQHTKDGKYIFDGDDIENTSYSYFIDHIKDSMDVNYGNLNTVLQYESLGTGANAHNILFSINTWPDVYYLIYCDTCSGCSHCFLCTGLRNKSYCILNKQYTKEEYEELVPRIIEKMMADGEWGEFFPASMSPFGYNETVAQEYFPVPDHLIPSPSPKREGGKTVIEVVVPPPSPKGEGMRVKWSLYEAPFPRVEKIIPAEKLPDDISKIPDDILNWAIECEVSKKPFRIIKQELDFYRKHNIPIPRRHPDMRHMDRMKMRNPRKLHERLCDCERCEENHRNKGIILKEGENAESPPVKGGGEGRAGGFGTDAGELEQNPPSPSTLPPFTGGLRKKMITTYAPERPERVYCGTCYEKEVVG